MQGGQASPAVGAVDALAVFRSQQQLAMAIAHPARDQHALAVNMAIGGESGPIRALVFQQQQQRGEAKRHHHSED